MRVFTELENQAIIESEAILREARFDVDHEHGSQNAQLVLDYFDKNPTIPVSVASICAFVNANRDRFVWISKARHEYDKVARENPAAAEQLAQWFQTQGKPSTLVNTGDEYFDNSTRLLVELRGRSVDSPRIHEAIGRISFRPGRPLHYLPAPRVADPRQHKDDEPFLGKDLVKMADGSLRSKTPAEQRRDAELAEAAKNQAPKAKGPVDEWQAIAAGYLGSGGSHGRNANLQAVYDRGTNGELSWREVARQMGELKKSYSVLLPTASY